VTSAEVVALIGPRASGKTSVGRELARRLGWPFVDLDDEIARRDAEARGSTDPLPAGRILERDGEAAFRDLESRALEAAFSRPRPFVLATGGGVVERRENRTMLSRRATCVWLRVAPAELERRLRSDPTPRPSLTGVDPAEEITAVLERREPLYAEICDIELDGRGLQVGEAARRVAERLGRGRPGGCGGA
jgi:shikimate kinase